MTSVTVPTNRNKKTQIVTDLFLQAVNRNNHDLAIRLLKENHDEISLDKSHISALKKNIKFLADIVSVELGQILTSISFDFRYLNAEFFLRSIEKANIDSAILMAGEGIITDDNDSIIDAVAQLYVKNHKNRDLAPKIEELIEKVNSGSEKQKIYTKLFFQYLKKGDSEQAIAMIYKGIDLSQRDMTCEMMVDRNIPLIRAVQLKDHEVVSALLGLGADPNQKNDSSSVSSPLSYCVSHSGGMMNDTDPNHQKIFRELILHSANINEKPHTSSPSIFQTCLNFGMVEFCKILIANGADILEVDPAGENILHKIANLADQALNPIMDNTCGSGDMTVSQLAIEKKLMDQKDDLGQTPLFLASENNNTKLVEFLVANGAEIDLENLDGMTPAMLALCNNHIDCYKYLVSKGAEEVNLIEIARDKAGLRASDDEISTAIEEFRATQDGSVSDGDLLALLYDHNFEEYGDEIRNFLPKSIKSQRVTKSLLEEEVEKERKIIEEKIRREQKNRAEAEKIKTKEFVSKFIDEVFSDARTEVFKRIREGQKAEKQRIEKERAEAERQDLISSRRQEMNEYIESLVNLMVDDALSKAQVESPDAPIERRSDNAPTSHEPDRYRRDGEFLAPTTQSYVEPEKPPEDERLPSYNIDELTEFAQTLLKKELEIQARLARLEELEKQVSPKQFLYAENSDLKATIAGLQNYSRQLEWQLEVQRHSSEQQRVIIESKESEISRLKHQIASGKLDDSGISISSSGSERGTPPRSDGTLMLDSYGAEETKPGLAPVSFDGAPARLDADAKHGPSFFSTK